MASTTTHAGASSSDEGLPAGVLRAACEGEEWAWRRLIEAYGRRIFAMAKSRLGDPEAADEIAQSVFATLAEKLADGGYTEQGKFEAWLFRIVMNRIRDAARQRRRHAISGVGPALDHAEAGGSATQSDAAANDTAQVLGALRSALDTLPEADREVVELRHHGRMPFREMAALLGEPMGTLLARHHRALRKLRSVMEEAGIDASRIDAIPFGNG